MVGIKTDDGSDACDLGDGNNKYCDPYVQLTLTDEGSEPQVFKTKTVTNSALLTTIDETFYFEKVSQKAEILIEIYDANEDEIFNDRLMYEQKFKLPEFFKQNIFGKATSVVIINGFWRPELLRRNSTNNHN